jgi:hypothetical protein
MLRPLCLNRTCLAVRCARYAKSSGAETGEATLAVPWRDSQSQKEIGGTGHDGRTLRDATGHRALRETWVENGAAQRPRLAVQKPEPNREEPVKTGGV